MTRSRISALLLAVVVAMAPWCGASAQDHLKVAVGARGVGETFVAELGQDAGIFKKHGLTLDVLYTQGGGETQQVDLVEVPATVLVLMAAERDAVQEPDVVVQVQRTAERDHLHGVVRILIEASEHQQQRRRHATADGSVLGSCEQLERDVDALDLEDPDRIQQDGAPRAHAVALHELAQRGSTIV